MALCFWDCLLVIVVAIQVMMIAYVYEPRWKAFILTLPVPFTVSTLAVGQPINATHVLGLIVLLIFTTLVRVFHYRYHVPIVLAIILSAAAYCVFGTTINHFLPKVDCLFGASCLLAALVAIMAWFRLPVCREQGHRSSLPVWIKCCVVVGVILFLLLLKKQLQGFMTVFPMVGVVAAYESRKCLWTINRQMPKVMLTLLTLMMIAHGLYPSLGMGLSLAVGWLAFGVVLGIMENFWRFRLLTMGAYVRNKLRYK